jgi:hypothetical protein
MQKKFFVVVLLLALMLASSAFAGLTCNNFVNGQLQSSPQYRGLREALHNYLACEILLERNFITSAVANIKDKSLVTERLHKNHQAIGALLQPYYGSDAGDKFTQLLDNDIKLFDKIIQAERVHNQVRVASLTNKRLANAGALVVLLSILNAYWVEKTVNDALHDHLTWTLQSVQARIKKDWATDFASLDDECIYSQHFADLLLEGIAKQFPEKFAPN